MSLVTTSETKAGSALAKNGTEATRDRQLKLMTSCNNKIKIKFKKYLRKPSDDRFKIGNE